ncbi:peptidase S58 family protein [Candidatus Marinimicrobia bacterium MT.SAG.4]|nr:peptidase S58 family protein [Candidatus Marinimicrobia bacterium MT.SAG.4]
MWEWSNSITDVPGLSVGVAQNEEAQTGCTVALFRDGAIAGVDVRGSAPGSSEIEAIKPVRVVDKIHGVLLTGGSAFGLSAAGGVLKYLEEQEIGYDVTVTQVPIVPTAVIFDLRVGSSKIRPDLEMGYEAAKNASTAHPAIGLHGVGIGASAGGISGEDRSRGGFGTTSIKIDDKITVGVMTVANPLGNVFDNKTGKVIAGNLDRNKWILPKTGEPWIENTVLVLVATNAKLNKEEATKVAQMAQDGIARTIIPSHTMHDGDIVFAVSTGSEECNINVIGDAAAEAVAYSIILGVSAANGIELDTTIRKL